MSRGAAIGSHSVTPATISTRSTCIVTISSVMVGGKPTAGVMKDVVMLGGFQEIAFDFVADNPGRTLFHCHQQLHMDFGFMALFDYV